MPLTISTISDSINGILQFVTVVIIFIVVVGITLLATRWLANYQKSASTTGNIEVIETFRLTTNKYVQILRVGTKYLTVAIGREEVTFLGELSPADIKIDQTSQQIPVDFSSVLARLRKNPDGRKGASPGGSPDDVSTNDNTPPQDF